MNIIAIIQIHNRMLESAVSFKGSLISILQFNLSLKEGEVNIFDLFVDHN